MKNKRVMKPATFVLSLLALLLSTGGLAQPDRIVYAQSVPVTTLDPAHGAFLAYPAGYEVSYALYDRLVTFDADLNIVPQLATEWEVSEDGLEWTFQLHSGVTFHDGTPFDSDAVVFNIERMVDTERNPTNRPLWDPVAGANEIDEDTVRITTSEPFPALLNTLAHGSGAMVSPTAVEQNGEESIATSPVGTGPFSLESFSPGQEVVLSAYEDYWGKAPQTRQLVFQYVPEASTRISALRTGQVDVIDAVPPQLASTLQGDPNVQILSKPGLRPMGFAIMTGRAPLDDVRVRQALNYAVPTGAIANSVFQGFARPADSPLAFNTSGHTSVGSYQHDPERARELLAEAGWEDGNGDGVLDKGGQRLLLTLYTPEGLFPGDLAISEIAASSLQQVGVAVEIVQTEAAAYWDYLRLPPSEIPWDLAQFGFNPSNADGTYHLDSLFSSNPPGSAAIAAWNIAQYRNEEVDALLARAKTTVAPAERNELLARVQEIVWEESPYIWLQVNEVISAARADLQGVEVWPTIFTIVRGAHR
jgi:ABC-type transport system substrate-binding protein